MAGRIHAGDIIKLGGSLEYVFDCSWGEGMEVLGINACSEGWMARGLSSYGDECYPLTAEDMEEAEVVGHYGLGRLSEGQRWHANGRALPWAVTVCSGSPYCYEQYVWDQYVTEGEARARFADHAEDIRGGGWLVGDGLRLELWHYDEEGGRLVDLMEVAPEE